MARKSDRVADWSVALVLLMVISVAAGFTPRERIDWSVRRISGAVALLRPSRGMERSDVIILSGEANDRFAVGATLEPRGYVIHHAPTAEQAIAEMRRQPGGIAMVIVDESAPGARGTLLAARKICPEACPVLLKGHREPAQVASIVAGALDRHFTPSQSNELHQEALLHK
jgi:hypothetical protein